MDAPVPLIHVTDHADAPSGRRPDREVRARYSCDRLGMRAKLFISVEVAAFAHEMEIEVGEKKRKYVRIENLKGFAGMRAALDLVAAGLGRSGLIGGPDRLEEAFRTQFYGVGDVCFRSPRNEKANGPPGTDRMSAENGEGIGVLANQESIHASVELGRWLTLSRCGWRWSSFGVFGRQEGTLRQAIGARELGAGNKFRCTPRKREWRKNYNEVGGKAGGEFMRGTRCIVRKPFIARCL